MSLLFLAAVALQPSPASPPTDLPQQCRAKLQQMVRGELGDITVSSVTRGSRTLTLRGTVNVLSSPAARPGELAPHHVLNDPHTYSCSMRGERIVSVHVTPLHR